MYGVGIPGEPSVTMANMATCQCHLSLIVASSTSTDLLISHAISLKVACEKSATGIAESMGATADVQIPLTTSYPVTYNDPDLTAEMLPVLQAVAGADRVHLTPAETGAEDFSFIAEQVPGFYITLGGRPADVAEEDAADHHTPDFFIDDSGLGLGVRAMTAMALHYLRNHQ